MVLEPLTGPFIFISLHSRGSSTEFSKSHIPATSSPPPNKGLLVANTPLSQ